MLKTALFCEIPVCNIEFLKFELNFNISHDTMMYIYFNTLSQYKMCCSEFWPDFRSIR